MSLITLLQTIADELPGCELTSVVSLDTGLSLAAATTADPNDAAAADAFHSELYRLTRNALAEAGAVSEIEDVVVQGGRRTFVSSPLGDSGYFWHVSTRSDTTLGFTQAVMRKYRDEVMRGISDLTAQ